MTTASPRRIRRRREDPSRQAAFSFLSNISLGTESSFEPAHRRVTSVPDKFRPEDPLEEDSTKKAQFDGIPVSHNGKENQFEGTTRPTLSISIPTLTPAKGMDVSPTSPYNEDSTIDLASRRNNSLHDEAATSFLLNISLDARSVQDRPSKESLTKPVREKIAALESGNTIDESDKSSVKSSNGTVGTAEETEGFAKITRRQSSVSLKDKTNASLLSPDSMIPPSDMRSNWHEEEKRESLSSSYGSVKTQHSAEYGDDVNFQDMNRSGLPLSVQQPGFMLPSSSESTFGSILSMLGFKDDKKRRRRDTLKQNPNDVPEKRNEAESFAYLLTPNNTLGPEHEETGYDPYYLDDPELKLGKSRPGKTLSNIVNSIWQQKHTRESDLKRAMNARFRQSHPNIDPSLTLTQIRTVKEKLLASARNEDLNLDIELSTVAKSFVYFEKLVLKKLVTKHNRRLIAAICLFLASKVNEPKETSYPLLLESLHKNFDVSEKDVKEHEFSVFASLGFELYVPRSEFMPHFDRIFGTLDYSDIQEYLGNNPFYEL